MIVNLKSESDLSGFYVVFNGAANLETRGIFGISHLMEHLICKNFEHLRDDFEKDGIDWNAFTTQNEIVFFFTGLEKYLSYRRQELVDLITDFKVNKEQFENERKIILQEYKNNFSNQIDSHMFNLNRKLYNTYGAIGLKEDLESLRFMDCINFFEKQFKNPTKIINVSKSNPFKSDVDFIENKIDKKFEFGPYNDAILETSKNYGEKSSLIMCSKLTDKEFNTIGFINKMLTSGLSSPLYSEVREKKGLVYRIRCQQVRMNQQGYSVIHTETSNKNINQVIDTIKSVLNNPNKFLSKKRFNVIYKFGRVKC